MDVPQLKLLAGRVRSLLQQSPSQVGHNQSLDLIAALPGLRNWPEVVAFPNRVAACELDVASTGRLAFRLKKALGVEFTARDLLSTLAPDGSAQTQDLLQVWPAGPPAGVYVTTSPEAIAALLARYEEATDGGLVYAERAGGDWAGSIDLGDYGLWSPGIERLPSGTLFVVGPIQLDQQSWNEAAERLEIACLNALNSNHRVAVLFDTPTPGVLRPDSVVLLRSATAGPSDIEDALVGVIGDDGDLQPCRPFATAYPKPAAIPAHVGFEAVPESVRELLRRELANHTSGFVLFGSSHLREHSAYDQLAAGLALTEHAGPAARIMPRHRGTPSKDWLVPDAIKALPFLPSIESAYAHGYRRMVIDPRYSNSDALLNYEDVLFLSGTYNHDVADIALQLIVATERMEAKLIKRIVAVLGLLKVPGKQGEAVASDLFLGSAAPEPVGQRYEEFQSFLRANRVIRWEDELASLLDARAVSATRIKKERISSEVVDFLAQRRNAKKTA